MKKEEKGAIILLKGMDNIHSDPKKNETVCWKKWDLVGVFPIGWKFGRMEVFPKFYKVIVTNGSRKEIEKKYIGPHTSKGFTIEDTLKQKPIEIQPIMLLRSKYRFYPENLSEKQKEKFFKTGEIIINNRSLKKYLFNKVISKTADKIKEE